MKNRVIKFIFVFVAVFSFGGCTPPKIEYSVDKGVLVNKSEYEGIWSNSQEFLILKNGTLFVVQVNSELFNEYEVMDSIPLIMESKFVNGVKRNEGVFRLVEN